MRYTYHYRSYFWPALLILAGVVALLVNVGTISVDRLYQLLDLWPLILIVLGLELILRRTVTGTAGDVAALLIVLLAVLGAIGYVSLAPNPSASHSMDAVSPAGGVDQASLEIDVGSATITLSGTTDVGTDLYRAHIDYSGPKPEVSFNQSTGRVTISQSSSGVFQTRKFALTLLLNPGIPWTIEENSGATTDTLNLSQLHVTSLKLNTGASRHDIRLGPVSGTVPIEVNGGALTVNLHVPSGVAAQVSVSGGAVSLNADGRSMHAIGSLTHQVNDYGSAADRYRIMVNGGACTVSIDSTEALG